MNINLFSFFTKLIIRQHQVDFYPPKELHNIYIKNVASSTSKSWILLQGTGAVVAVPGSRWNQTINARWRRLKPLTVTTRTPLCL